MTNVVSDSESGSGSEMDEETGLTNRDRRQKPRRQEQLDVGKDVHVLITEQEKKLADRDVVKKLLLNSVLILLWYFFSLSISIVSTVMIVNIVCDIADGWLSAVQQMDV